MMECNMNNQTYSRIFTCLFVLVGISIAVTGSAAAQPADLVVATGGTGDYTSIQHAIDKATSGDKIEIQSGTYEQGIVIDKNIRIVTSGDVTLDGNNINTGTGIKINATDVSVDGVEVARFGGTGSEFKEPHLMSGLLN
jgi:nitrous oxidase accessory protein NosD